MNRTEIQDIMYTAWAIARSGAEDFGGSVRDYFAAALKEAWADHKERAEEAAAVVGRKAEAKARSKARAAEIMAFIAKAHADGKIVNACTALSVTAIKPEHIAAGLVYTDGTSVYVRRGRKADCLDLCSFKAV